MHESSQREEISANSMNSKWNRKFAKKEPLTDQLTDWMVDWLYGWLQYTIYRKDDCRICVPYSPLCPHIPVSLYVRQLCRTSAAVWPLAE